MREALHSYGPADTSPAAEFHSFRTQMEDAAVRRLTVKPPTEDEAGLVLAWMEKAYSGLPGVDENWASRENFLSELRNLDLTSSPGWPYMRSASTIKQWLGADDFGNYDEQRVEMLWYDTQQVLAGTYEHWFRVFVKDEPHKAAKVKAGRWRLIIAASLPVQMAWRLCFSRQNDWLNENPYSTPSAHGLVFAHGGWRRFKAHCQSAGIRYSRDISAWDINAPGWVFRLIREFRTRMRGPDSWRTVVSGLYRDAFKDSRLLFSRGFVLQQTFEGFMKSGLFNTIADNSLAMVMMHVLASFRARVPVGAVWATGDDVLQSYISDGYIRELEGLGCKVKEYSQCLDFMGTNFSKKPKPMYFHKHIVNAITVKVDVLPDLLDSYLRLYAYSDRRLLWETFAQVMGIRVHSGAYYECWYSSPLAAHWFWE